MPDEFYKPGDRIQMIDGAREGGSYLRLDVKQAAIANAARAEDCLGPGVHRIVAVPTLSTKQLTPRLAEIRHELLLVSPPVSRPSSKY